MMDESRFSTLADETLMRLFDALDAVAGDSLEVDLEEGALVIELESGARYLINKHAPDRQIWLSSPLSGGRHFYYEEASGRWLDTRSGEGGEGGTLEEMLAREIGPLVGTILGLDSPYDPNKEAG